MNWIVKRYDELSRNELYTLLRLRAEVFIVEQNCPYQDLDDKDQQSYHVWCEQGGIMAAYTRIVPPGISYDGYSSIGRVVSSPEFRGTGIGKKLMRKSVEVCEELFPAVSIKISAQFYLVKFYNGFKFQEIGEIYLEDDIDHIAMIRTMNS